MNPISTPALPDGAHDHRRRWIALTLLSLTQFILVIDVSIVNIALGAIQRSLDFSQENLQWILSAYTLTFGGLLLLGGRMADLFGRRRVFMAGLVVFVIGSACCGFAQSELMLILSRGLQGVGAAVISPGALSILTTTFQEGAERNKALGIWGAIAGVGGAVGVLAGGVLVEFTSWRWVFLLNLPIGLLVLLLVPRFVDESRGHGRPRLDLGGSLTITGGLAALIYGLTRAETDGWTEPFTLVCLGVAVALIVGSLVIESVVHDPLLPLGIFRNRTLTGANVVGFLLGASIFAMFFFLSLYMLQVLRYSALGVGMRYLLFAAVIIVAAGASQALVTRIGVRPVLATGMLLLVLGLVYLTFIDVNGTYPRDLVPGFILAGVGMGFSFVPVSIAALQGVQAQLAGVASGLINTSQQVGGAVGIAILSTIANSVARGDIEDAAAAAAARGGDPSAAAAAAQPQALVDGFTTAFWVGAGMAVVGVVCALFIMEGVRVTDVGHGAHGGA